jgi:cytochrome c
MICNKKALIPLTISACILTLGFSTNAYASKDLAQKNACLSCHGIDKKLVGPAFTVVAAKYKDDKDAATTLANAIKAGGSGKYGPIPMPAQPNLSVTDASTLAKWILSGAK